MRINAVLLIVNLLIISGALAIQILTIYELGDRVQILETEVGKLQNQMNQVQKAEVKNK